MFRPAALAFILLPGVGAVDPRITLNPLTTPGAAIARLQVPGVSRCTAVVVAPTFAVTAAHCLTRPGLGHFVAAGSVHLLLGYRSGAFTRHIVPDLMLLPRGADPAGRGAHTSDIAVLHFAPAAENALSLDPAPPAPGLQVQLAGFSQDRSERLQVDPDCRITGSGPLLTHTCTGSRGTSGGPLLAGGRVVGIQVAGGRGEGGLAVPAAAVAALLPR